MTPFPDRAEAGRLLAAALAPYQNRDVVVVAIPPGGAQVAAEIAHVLNAPLGVVLVTKVVHPEHQAISLGAISDSSGLVGIRDDDTIARLGLDEAGFQRAWLHGVQELHRRHRLFGSGSQGQLLAGRTVIIVDDAIMKGLSARAALRAIRARRPAHVVLASPVASATALAGLRDEADEIVCLATPPQPQSLAQSYLAAAPVTDQEAKAILEPFFTA